MADIDAEKLPMVNATIAAQYPLQIQLIIKDLSSSNVAGQILQTMDGTPVDVVINIAGFGFFGSINEPVWQREIKIFNLHVLTTTL